MDPSQYNHGYGMPNAGTDKWQDVLNAVPIPAGWHTPIASIPVTVRVVWAVDGEERVDGQATRWTDAVVYVEFADQRKATTGCWVAAADVVRR